MCNRPLLSLSLSFLLLIFVKLVFGRTTAYYVMCKIYGSAYFEYCLLFSLRGAPQKRTHSVHFSHHAKLQLCQSTLVASRCRIWDVPMPVFEKKKKTICYKVQRQQPRHFKSGKRKQIVTCHHLRHHNRGGQTYQTSAPFSTHAKTQKKRIKSQFCRRGHMLSNFWHSRSLSIGPLHFR